MADRGKRRRVLLALGAGIGASVFVGLARLLRKRAPQEVRPRGAAAIGWALLLSFAASVTLAVVYSLGGQPQLEGAMLFGSLGGLAVALVLWSHHLLPNDLKIEERPRLLGERGERIEAERSFEIGAEQMGRRTFLTKMLFAAAGALGFTLLIPLRSCGEAPGDSLSRTAWRRGKRAVTPDGQPVRASEMTVDEVLTVFPEGAVTAADSQVVLIKVPDQVIHRARGRETWSPEGLLAYSKICTHAGCPVGLYQAETRELYCPCHQSVFSVPDGARPTNGPATRALPQLPLSIDAEGYVVAQSDFDEPVGPEFWHFGRNR